MTPKTWAFLFSNIVLLTIGQVLWKVGLQRIGPLSLQSILPVLTSPWILAGLALFVVATGLWFIVLSSAPLSLAYPLQSLAYVVGMILAWLVFQELIPWTRWLGAGIIIVGVYLVSLR